MIKIISDPYTIHCGTCGVKFKYDASDVITRHVKVHKWLGMLSPTEKHIGVVCPICGIFHCLRTYQ